MGLVLYILSFLASWLILPFTTIYGIIKLFRESHFDRAFGYTDDSFMEIAKAKDKYGNANGKYFWNDILITKDSKHPFGDINQTISQVLGLNYLDGTLSKTGLWLNNILNYFWKDHTIKAAKGK